MYNEYYFYIGVSTRSHRRKDWIEFVHSISNSMKVCMVKRKQINNNDTCSSTCALNLLFYCYSFLNLIVNLNTLRDGSSRFLRLTCVSKKYHLNEF